MSSSKITRVLLSLTVFVLFFYLTSWHTHVVKPGTAVKISSSKSIIVSCLEPFHPRNARELALGLPDSLLPFSRGLKTSNEVALTFDACPTSGKNPFNAAIANILSETKTPATVFLSGRWIEEDTAAAKLLGSDSLIELGNHSFSHPHMLRMTVQGMKKELDRTQKIITDLTGRTPFLFRAPYGEYSDTLINAAKDLGLATVQYDVESGDPDTTFTAPRLIKWVSEKARNGSIVVMHINNRGWHTAEALPIIIQFLREKGYKLVKVSDFMREVGEQLTAETPLHSDLIRNVGPYNRK